MVGRNILYFGSSYMDISCYPTLCDMVKGKIGNDGLVHSNDLADILGLMTDLGYLRTQSALRPRVQGESPSIEPSTLSDPLDEHPIQHDALQEGSMEFVKFDDCTTAVNSLNDAWMGYTIIKKEENNESALHSHEEGQDGEAGANSEGDEDESDDVWTNSELAEAAREQLFDVDKWFDEAHGYFGKFELSLPSTNELHNVDQGEEQGISFSCTLVGDEGFDLRRDSEADDHQESTPALLVDLLESPATDAGPSTPPGTRVEARSFGTSSILPSNSVKRYYLEMGSETDKAARPAKRRRLGPEEACSDGDDEGEYL